MCEYGCHVVPRRDWRCGPEDVSDAHVVGVHVDFWEWKFDARAEVLLCPYKSKGGGVNLGMKRISVLSDAGKVSMKI